MRGGGREWVVVDRDPTSNESFETLETFAHLRIVFVMDRADTVGMRAVDPSSRLETGWCAEQ